MWIREMERPEALWGFLPRAPCKRGGKTSTPASSQIKVTLRLQLLACSPLTCTQHLHTYIVHYRLTLQPTTPPIKFAARQWEDCSAGTITITTITLPLAASVRVAHRLPLRHARTHRSCASRLIISLWLAMARRRREETMPRPQLPSWQ